MADLVGAFAPFAGMCAQMHNIGLLPNHAIVDSPDLSIAYGAQIYRKLENIARADARLISIITQ